MLIFNELKCFLKPLKNHANIYHPEGNVDNTWFELNLYDARISDVEERITHIEVLNEQTIRVVFRKIWLEPKEFSIDESLDWKLYKVAFVRTRII